MPLEFYQDLREWDFSMECQARRRVGLWSVSGQDLGFVMLQGKGREFPARQEGKWHIVRVLISRLDGFSGYCIGLSCRRVKLTWDVGAVQDHQPGLG